jgi:hypothetical protein
MRFNGKRLTPAAYAKEKRVLIRTLLSIYDTFALLPI